MVTENIPDAVKFCISCELQKPVSEFYRQEGRKDDLRAHCRTCTNFGQKKRRLLDPQKFRQWERGSSARRFLQNGGKKRYRSLLWRLKNKFGITIESFTKILQTQNDQCAICARDIFICPPGRGARESACLDHDHETKEIRGILCHACNTSLGLFGDDPAVVLRAYEYLARHKWPMNQPPSPNKP